MLIGYMVGIIVAGAILITGVVGAILAKKNRQKRKWPIWMILAGIVALVSAAVNAAIFGNGIF